MIVAVPSSSGVGHSLLAGRRMGQSDCPNPLRTMPEFLNAYKRVDAYFFVTRNMQVKVIEINALQFAAKANKIAKMMKKCADELHKKRAHDGALSS